MRVYLIAAFVVVLATSAAADDVPDPSNCTCDLDEVGRLLLCPGRDGPGGGWEPCAASAFSVNVRNSANAPIGYAVVEVLVDGLEGDYTGIASYGGPYTVKYADMYGDVDFNIPGGGCLKHQPDACVIRANGVPIRIYPAVMSPDYTGVDDHGIPGRWDCRVSPEDLAAFVAAYRSGTGPASCHDYDNNGTTDPNDLSVFVGAYGGAAGHCPP